MAPFPNPNRLFINLDNTANGTPNFVYNEEYEPIKSI